MIKSKSEIIEVQEKKLIPFDVKLIGKLKKMNQNWGKWPL